ncbi:MAG: calcium-binding protein [Pseudomonadota bacterium]
MLDPLLLIPLFAGIGLASLLFGSSGDEIGVGTEGEDTIVRAGGDDLIDAQMGADNVIAGAGNDTVNGGPGQDIIFGEEGDDEINGQEWSDVIIGGDGDDTLIGETGADQIDGGAGDDSIDGGTWADVLVGGDGADTLEGGIGNDELHAGLVLEGDYDFEAAIAFEEAIREGQDITPDPADFPELVAVHDTDVDILSGGSGADTLALGAGDIGSGGDGYDTFELHFDPALGDNPAPTQITDYEPGRDRIEVSYLEGNERPLVTVLDDTESFGALVFANGIVIAQIAGVAATDVTLGNADISYTLSQATTA